ncbi:Tl [Trypoxylus dichotomus]
MAATDLPDSSESIEVEDHPDSQNFTCVVSRASEQTIFCPSEENKYAEITLEFGNKVKTTCFGRHVHLIDFKIDVGEVEKFVSKNCNLANQLGQIFTTWDVKGVKRIEIESFFDTGSVLEKKQFDNVNVSQVTYIRMYRSNIIGIEPDTFRNFVNLEEIMFTWNKITTFPDLTYLSKVRKIDFGTNQISILPDRLNLPSLDMSSLNVLGLENNKIKYLPGKVLHPLTGITIFGVSGLREIPSDFFKNNRALKELSISNADLRSVSEDVLWGLSNLKVLRLINTLLETLPENLLKHQVNLQNLRLHNNRLKTLPSGIFRNLQSLKYLYMYDNQLQEWNFPHLPKLEVLEMFSNQLIDIKPDFSENMLHLTKLDLSKNRISYIGATAFKNLSLVYVNLSYNDLSDNEAGTMFMNETYAKTLNLGHNAYESVPRVLEGRIGELLMDFNKLKAIDILLPIPCNFSNNAIERVSLSMSDQFQAIKKTIEIDIGDNPIDCGCDAFPLVQHFGGNYSNKSSDKKISLTGVIQCQNPPNMAGINIPSIKPQTFTCDYEDSYACPEKCSCGLYPYYESFNITCSNRNLSTSPPIPRFTPKIYTDPNGFVLFSINKLTIDLSNNSIKNFTERDSSYVNATELNLSDNELNLVNWLPPRLEVLRLNGNKLENLGYNAVVALNDSEILKSLTLDGNSWNCNCNLFNFTKLIRTKHLKISSEDRILCTDGRKLLTVLEDSLCNFHNQIVLIIVGTCIFTLFMLSSIAFIIFKKYEYHVKVWIYSKPILMRFVAEDSLDRDKVYDAFVSFSHKDEAFVCNELVRELEKGPNPYKLCIHDRDWIVGDYIRKQIVDSVEKSRRTIIVLSRHFLESEWATIEFKTAHKQAMEERRHRLIVILYGDLDPQSIKDEDLRVYLSTNTYVQWGDAFFWKKLRNALPHKKEEPCNAVISKTKLKNKKVENMIVNIDKLDLINSRTSPSLETPPLVVLHPLLITNNPSMFNNPETPPAECGTTTPS